MEAIKLSFIAPIDYLNRAILQIEDPHLASNNTKYSLSDGILGALSVFFNISRAVAAHGEPSGQT
jgi:hypothetical protein